MAGAQADTYLPDEFGRLLVQCWCGRKFVNVMVEDVKAGLTRGCDAGCLGRAGLSEKAPTGRPRQVAQ